MHYSVLIWNILWVAYSLDATGIQLYCLHHFY